MRVATERPASVPAADAVAYLGFPPRYVVGIEEPPTLSDAEMNQLTVVTETAYADPRPHYYLTGQGEAVLATLEVAREVVDERSAQDSRWGEQNHPDGTSAIGWDWQAENAKFACEEARHRGQMSWRHILLEEVFEAFAEEDPAKLRAELIQVAAVAQAWVEAIDRRPRPAVAASGSHGDGSAA